MPTSPAELNDFNSRTSCEVRPMARQMAGGCPCHFNSRTSCEVRHFRIFNIWNVLDFNSRTSCEVRLDRRRRKTRFVDFNSRTSCEVRHVKRKTIICRAYFNSRTSCEVRRADAIADRRLDRISTHAPLARCDRFCRAAAPSPFSFQLTHLLRGATF